jgi:hypothetical protein
MYKKKGSWSLNSTRFPGKVGLLAMVLVETMALTNVRKLCLLGYHRLTLVIGRHGLGGDFSLCCVPRILEGDTPSRFDGHRY